MKESCRGARVATGREVTNARRAEVEKSMDKSGDRTAEEGHGSLTDGSTYQDTANIIRPTSPTKCWCI